MAVPQPEDDYPLCAHISTISCNGFQAGNVCRELMGFRVRQMEPKLDSKEMLKLSLFS